MGTTAELLNAGLTITFIGMSVVFVLLTTLVGVVTAMSALCRRFAPEVPAPSNADEDKELVSVIAAAINHYRRSRAI
jgi:sodium pump decarboxylase gamma subunit